VERADGKVIHIGGIAVVKIVGSSFSLPSAKELCMNKNSDEIEYGFQKIVELKMVFEQWLKISIFIWKYSKITA
jgi:hypothetical protein